MGYATDAFAGLKAVLRRPLVWALDRGRTAERRRLTRRARRDYRVLVRRPFPPAERVVYFASFHQGVRISETVFHSLEQWAGSGFALVFLSTAPALDPRDLERLALLAQGVILRANLGHDFFSWKVGLAEFPPGPEVRAVVWTNDSVYGPLRPVEAWWDRIEDSDADLVGMTDDWEMSYHLQSYFLVFRNRALSGGFLSRFAASIEVEPDKSRLVRRYEVGLTRQALAEGLGVRSLVDYRELVQRFGGEAFPGGYDSQNPHHLNPTFAFWEPLVSQGLSPFLKVSVLRDDPLKSNRPGRLERVWEAGQPTLALAAVLEHQKTLSQGKIP